MRLCLSYHCIHFFPFFSATITIYYDIKWIKVNSGQHGYYRVLYDDQNWEALLDQLKQNHAVFSAKVPASSSFEKK
jgi:hypothetical protein